MSEIEKALAELKALMEHRAKELGHEEEFRALGLTSRKNLCLHPFSKEREEWYRGRCQVQKLDGRVCQREERAW